MTLSTGVTRVVEAVRELRVALRDFDPAAVGSGADCAALAEELAAAEKACGAARAMAAARAVASGAHKEAGVADPLLWVARQGGTTGRDAKSALELARDLDSHPAMKEALLEGRVSLAQAKEIARAEAELPGQEKALLEVARDGDLSKVREAVRDKILTSSTPDELHRRQIASRTFRHWRDGIGMVRFEGALPPETGIPFVTRIERAAAQRHRAARRAGTLETFQAHAADALVELMSADGSARRGVNTELVIVCDLYAWRRGHAHEGEPSHIIGGGPIPVEVAKRLSRDAFLKIVLHDGVDIQKIKHAGRKYTAHLRTALDLGPVPTFGGRACVDCTRTWGLQHDHDDPVAHNGPTSVGNVMDRCYPCHSEKTEKDRRSGLLGPKARARGPGRPDTKRKPPRRSLQPPAPP